MSQRAFLTLFFLILTISYSQNACAGPLRWKTLELRTAVAADSEVITGRFEYTNAGQDPVRMISAVPSCECTKVEFDSAPIAPGKSGKIDVKFDAGQRSGPQKVAILVWTDRDGAEPVQLQWNLQLPAVMTLSPEVLVWKSGERGEKELRIGFGEDRGARLLEAAADDPAFAVQAGQNRVAVALQGTPGTPITHLRIRTSAKLRRLREIIVPLAVQPQE